MLTGISGNLELLQARVAQGRISEIERYIVNAQDAAQRAAALTHRLLAFARRQPLDTKPSDINRIVLGMEDMLHRTLGERVELQTVLTGDLWPALTDVNKFENAILNLAINARDAMPDGGGLIIETRNTQLDVDYARRPARQRLMAFNDDSGTSHGNVVALLDQAISDLASRASVVVSL
jgi:signal transduction histidine kinase